MSSHLSGIIWQFAVFALILLAAVAAWRVARTYRRWLHRRFERPPKWAGLSALALGLTLFALLAVGFGFFMDEAGAI